MKMKKIIIVSSLAAVFITVFFLVFKKIEKGSLNTLMKIRQIAGSYIEDENLACQAKDITSKVVIQSKYTSDIHNVTISSGERLHLSSDATTIHIESASFKCQIPADFESEMITQSFQDTVLAISKIHSPHEQLSACKNTEEISDFLKWLDLKMLFDVSPLRMAYAEYASSPISSVLALATTSGPHFIYWWPGNDDRCVQVVVESLNAEGLREALSVLAMSKLKN
jgi:hypothetical protein